MASGIYLIRNTVNGHCYVGSSVDIEHRWEQHHSSLKNGSHKNRYLQAAWNLYGEGNFSFEVDGLCPPSELRAIEQRLLDMGAGEYNLSRDATAPWRGVKRSPETCAKIGLAQIGRKQSRETVEKRIAKVSGQKRTPEQLERLRKAAVDKQPGKLCLERAHYTTRNIATKIEMVTTDGCTTTFPSMSAAVEAGFHSTSIRRSAKTSEPYKEARWTIKTAHITEAQAHGREVGIQTLLAANKARCTAIEAVAFDGTVTKFGSMNEVMRTGCNNTRVVRAINENRRYRGKTWRYAPPLSGGAKR